MRSILTMLLAVGFIVCGCSSYTVNPVPIYPDQLHAPPKVSVEKKFKIYIDFDDPCGTLDKETTSVKITNSNELLIRQLKFTPPRLDACPASVNIVRNEVEFQIQTVGKFNIIDETSKQQIGNIECVANAADAPEWTPPPIFQGKP